LNCLAVRDRLTEHAVGVLASGEAAAVDRHLQWCAACRKEMSELSRAAGTLTFSIVPADPPADLEDRVSEAVRSVARKRVPAAKRGRILVVGLVAAALVLSGLGWGAVMAGRASRLQDQVNMAMQERARALQQFGALLTNLNFSKGNKLMLATLSPAPGTAGRGAALTLLSPSSADQAVVQFAGLPLDKARFPYVVKLQGSGGAQLTVGRFTFLDTGGGGSVAKPFDTDLAAYDMVVVRDALGHIVLSGYLSDQLTLPSPTP
jgi:predicted anti-sigma-YlaC factor YlaD